MNTGLQTASPRTLLRIGSVENPVTITMYFVFGLIFAGFGVFMLYRGAEIPGAIFSMLGLVFAFGAGHSVLGIMRYGNVMLELEAPVVPGGALKARVVSPGGFAGARELLVSLRCKRVEWSKDLDGKGKSLVESVVWSTLERFPVVAVGKKAACKLEFRVPDDALPSEGDSTAVRTLPGIFWEIQVEGGEVEGVNFMRGFRFPIEPLQGNN